MSVATTNIKDVFKINIKPRHDSLTDQYHRIFMVKLLLISSFVMGISWFNISCLVVGMNIYILLNFLNRFSKIDYIQKMNSKEIFLSRNLSLVFFWNLCVTYLTFQCTSIKRIITLFLGRFQKITKCFL